MAMLKMFYMTMAPNVKLLLHHRLVRAKARHDQDGDAAPHYNTR